MLFYIGFSFTAGLARRRRLQRNNYMTQLEVRFRYGAAPGEKQMSALDTLRDVYGIRRITFDDKERIIRVEFDASRLKEPAVAALLRRAGIDVQERLVLT